MSWIARSLSDSFRGEGETDSNSGTTTSSVAARMAAEADIRKLLDCDGEVSGENEKILASRFDSEDVARVRRKIQEEKGILELLTAQSESQPAGEAVVSPSRRVLAVTDSNITSPKTSLEDVEVWRKKAAQLQSTVDKLQTTLSALENQRNQEREEHAMETQTLTQQVREWKDKVEAAESKTKLTQEELVQIRSKARTLAQEARDTMEASRDESQAMVKSLQDTMSQLKEEWHVEREMMTKNKNTLQEQVATLQQEVGALTHQRNSAVAANEAMQNQLNQVQLGAQETHAPVPNNEDSPGSSENGMDQKSKANLSKEMAQLHESFNVSQQEIEVYYAKRSSSISFKDLGKACEQAEQIHELEEALQEARNKVLAQEQSFQKKEAELEDKLDAATAATQGVTAERDSLRASLKESIAQLESTAESRMTQLQESQTQIESLKKEKQDLLQSKAALEESHAKEVKDLKTDFKTKLGLDEQEKVALQSTQSAFEAKLKTATKQLEEATSSILDLTQVNSKLTKREEAVGLERDNLQSQVNVMMGEKADLQASNKSLQLSLDEVQKQYSNEKSKVEDTMSQLMEVGQEKAKLENTVNSLQASLEKAQEKSSQDQMKLKEVEGKKEELQAVVTTLKSSLGKALTSFEPVEVSLIGAEQRHAEDQQQMQDAIRDLSALVETQQSELAASKQALADAKEHCSVLEEKLQEAKRLEHGKALGANVELKEELQETKQRVDDLAGEVTRLQAEVGETAARETQLKEKLDEAKQMISALDGELQRKKTELEETADMTSQLQTELDQVSGDRDILRGANVDLKSTLEESKSTSQALHDELERVKQEQATTAKQVDETFNLQGQIKVLESAVKEKEKLVEDLEKRLAMAESAQEELENDLERGIKKKKPFWQCG